MSPLGPQAQASPDARRAGTIVDHKLVLLHPHAAYLLHLVHSKNLVNWSASLGIPRPETPELVIWQLDVMGGPALAFVLGKTVSALAVDQFYLSLKAELARLHYIK